MSNYRRFSRNDGVQLLDGRFAIVSSPQENLQYFVKILDTDELLLVEQKGLISVPKLNKGKYGGPTWGGAPGGWIGGNNYK